MHGRVIEADWPAPAGVVGFTSTRCGGYSQGCWQGLNMGHHVADDPANVAANRQLIAQSLPAGAAVPWLTQVHGTAVVEAGEHADLVEADASWTRTPGVVCAVLTADCLPVLFCDRSGSVVAAAHAGWRGLCAGVLEATVEAMSIAPGQLLAWLGPAIGPLHFEVGAEVREAFLAAAPAAANQISACFQPSPGREQAYFADLYALARLRLSALGLQDISGGQYCTFAESEQFYSYRRDGQTGRMASMIYLNPR